jgi:6-pyruvoyltetrahydropterin/6-carboxytetrahydropterin synthase
LCTNPHWHGHNYVLEVTVKGRPDPETGYIIDLGELKRILHRAVVDKCDHRNLNTEVDFLRGTIPSTENLVIAFWREIAPHLPPAAALHRVRLYETPRNFADFYGPDAP